MIELRHVQKKFGDHILLKDVNTTINKGEVIVIIGPSGCGKSTLLRCINLLGAPTGGQIFYNGEEVTKKGYDIYKYRGHVGMIFQAYNLFNHLTVIENIMQPQIDLLHRSKQEAYDKAYKLLDEFHLASKLYNYPESLSGGQRQRISIARQLAMESDVILFDEPTSALDPAMVGEVEKIISSLKEEGKTMLIVTHDMKFAKNVASRVFYVDEGGIYEDGTADEIFNHPKKPKTIAFIKNNELHQFKIDKTNDILNDITGIRMFCNKHGLSEKKASHAQLLFEEYITNIFEPYNIINSGLDVGLSYNEEKESLTFKFVFEGSKIVKYTFQDKISSKLVKGFTTNYKHYIEDNHQVIEVEVK